MDYITWRNEIFGAPPGCDSVHSQLPEDVESIPMEEGFDYLDRSLVDPEIHLLFSKEQIGIGLYCLYSECLENIPHCYGEAGDDSRRIKGLLNLRYLYTNFFDRYCSSPVKSIGNDLEDGQIGYLCYIFWDIFWVSPYSASTGMISAGLEVMQNALYSKYDHSIVSAIHELGHWVYLAPKSAEILEGWLEKPTTQNEVIHDYAEQATTGYIL